MTLIPAVEFRGVTKRFSGILANDRVGFAVAKGEIHAVVGENGAGKTTLMNLLSGLCQAEEGEIWLQGSPAWFAGPQDAIHMGIGMVHQHFMLVDRFSVLQNIILSCENSHSWINWDQARIRIESVCKEFGLALALDQNVGDLPVGLRQRVEIAKILYSGGDILIFDEPTAVLTPTETEELLSLLRSIRAQGKTILYVSHKLTEVLAIADRITVLRQGRLVGTVESSAVTRDELVEMMIGRALYPTRARQRYKSGSLSLELQDVCCRNERKVDALQGLSLQVRAGEMYGVAGVNGNGQQELAGVVAGARAVTFGLVKVDGVDISGNDATAVRRLGVALIPEDRDRQGLIADMSVWENMILGQQRQLRFGRPWFLFEKDCQRYVAEKIREYGIRLATVLQPARSLSGGNRQKVVLARELSVQPKVLVAFQPVRGLDVGAAELVYERLRLACDAGVAVLLISSDLEEILTMADRVGILYNGRIVCEFVPGELTLDEIGRYMLTGRQSEAFA